jgi:hypothetical protein
MVRSICTTLGLVLVTSSAIAQTVLVGRAIDADGEAPLADVRIDISPIDRSGEDGKSAWTQRDGSFAVIAVSVGLWRVRATRYETSFAISLSTHIKINRTPVSLEFVLPAPMRAWLEQRSSDSGATKNLTTITGFLKGTEVRDAAGKRLAETEWRLYEDAEAAVAGSVLGSSAVETSRVVARCSGAVDSPGSDGTYLLEHLRAGPCRLSVEVDGREVVVQHVQLAGGLNRIDFSLGQGD